MILHYDVAIFSSYIMSMLSVIAYMFTPTLAL